MSDALRMCVSRDALRTNQQGLPERVWRLRPSFPASGHAQRERGEPHLTNSGWMFVVSTRSTTSKHRCVGNVSLSGARVRRVLGRVLSRPMRENQSTHDLE